MLDGNRADLRAAARQPLDVSGGAKVGVAHIEERSRRGMDQRLDVWEDEGGASVSRVAMVDLPGTDEGCAVQLFDDASVREHIGGKHSEAQEGALEQEGWQPLIEPGSEINPFVNRQNPGAQLAGSLPSTEPEAVVSPQPHEFRA